MTATGPRVGVVGSANVDLVVRVGALPRPGETVLGGDVERLAGGKGANQAAAAARLGAHSSLIACVGDDDAGEWLVAGLVAQGVDVSRVARRERPTGVALITVDAFGENQIVVAPGANAQLSLAGVDLSGFDVVLASLESGPGVAADAVRSGSRVVLNAAPAMTVDPFVLGGCLAVVVNEVEAEALGVSSLAHCVVTLGARGAVRLDHGREVVRASAPALDAVDTVGAGDAFCAAYAVSLARGDAPALALAFATCAGALATRARGAQGSLPTSEEVVACLA
ncbi:MAG: PfkB family carbohydrate kinase [Acidimicrobiales bacterium]